MAKDRQRAKQRRRQREAPNAPKRARKRDRAFTDPESLEAASAGTPGDDALDAARDAGVEDVLDEVGPEGTTPAPDPLKHSSAYVDEAKLAEAGAELPRDEDADPYRSADEDFEGEDDLERAPDEVENDLLPASSAARAGFDPAVADDLALHPRRKRGRVITFLGHCVDELRRVQWPNRRQVGQATGVVLAFVIVAGGYLGALDALWKPIVNAII